MNHCHNISFLDFVHRVCCHLQDIFVARVANRHTNRVYHWIDTSIPWPICQPPQRLTFKKKADMNCMVGDRKGRGVIQKSDSTWLSPAVLIQKDGGLQVCVEYQRLNDNTEDCFMLLQNDDTLDTLIGVKWFSTFDLKNGYWQVLLQPDDKENMVISIGDVL